MSSVLSGLSDNVFVNTIRRSTLFKILIFTGFVFLLKDVILNIFIFFGIESTNVFTYLSWFTFLLILLIILPSNNGIIKDN
jgi:hypothetical protein